ncbi:50S ribosomal protein L13 [Aciduliprofundum sp. MAR08-339]|uniref:50S ribosomal protein L13 n=1 Tax=Aciduliprofundum sp. (strain MAR08-339) TaxID=673860 RepID=UPI00064EF7E9
MAIIDADNAVLGRLASIVAKRLLNGEEIIIVNAEKAVIVGNKSFIIEKYKERRNIGSVRKGPHYPRMPDRILRRTVKGMLPIKKSHGKEAYRRLKVYMGVPKELKSREFEVLEDAKNNKLEGFITLKDLSIQLGAKLR